MGSRTTFSRAHIHLLSRTVQSTSCKCFALQGIALAFCAALLTAASDSAAAHQPPTPTPLHHFDLPCVTCHESQTTNGVAWLAQLTNTSRINGDINWLCATAGCHDFDPALSHPVGVVPKSAIGANMPLDSRSRITCLTCHDNNDSSENLSYLDIGLERSLRRPSGMEFCARCHLKMGGTLLEQSHWRFSTRAHLRPMKPQSQISQDGESITADLDDESRTCLSCHDKVTVTIPALNETAAQKRARRRTMTDHPIAMSYELTAVQKKPGKFKFPLHKRSQIRLFDGKLGCGSCHNPYSQTEKSLVAPQTRGILCRKCHNM